MKFKISLQVVNPTGIGEKYNSYTIVEDTASDELQARGIASSITGCNMLDIPAFPSRGSGYTKCLHARLTDTTIYYLYLG